MRERTHSNVQVALNHAQTHVAHALAVLVILLSLLVVVAPFLLAITRAFALALIAHSVHERIQKRLRHKPKGPAFVGYPTAP